MRREVQWERMFPDELEEAFAERPVVYFAYGICEPHGPQNAVGLDGLKAHRVAVETARTFGGIVAPADFWHVHEIGGYAVWAARHVGEVERTWLTAVPPWIHFRNVCYQIRAAEVTGFHAAILLTGHYGPNWQDLKLLVELIQPYVRMRLYALPDFEANQPGFDRDGRSGGDHAGKVETSLLWALEPDCVDVSRIPEEDSAEGPRFAMGADARQADRRVGELMVADEVLWLGAKADELLDDYDRLCGVAGERPDQPRGFRSFAEVEEFWSSVMRPRLGELKSMQRDFGAGDEVPRGSVWEVNRDVGGEL